MFTHLLLTTLFVLQTPVPEKEKDCCSPPCTCCKHCDCELEWLDVLVKRVVDGDTIVVEHKGEAVKIRLLGVDTPESVNTHTGVQPGGKKATLFTRESLAGKKVDVRFEEKHADTFGRKVGMIILKDGSNFNQTLVREGIGRYYPRFKFDPVLMKRFKEAEDRAKAEKVGIWR